MPEQCRHKKSLAILQIPKAELCIESLLVMSHVGIIEHNYI